MFGRCFNREEKRSHVSHFGNERIGRNGFLEFRINKEYEINSETEISVMYTDTISRYGSVYFKRHESVFHYSEIRYLDREKVEEIIKRKNKSKNEEDNNGKDTASDTADGK